MWAHVINHCLKYCVIIAVLPVTFLSCGPRSGIHNNTDDEDLPGCGVVSNPALEGRMIVVTRNQERGEKIYKQDCAVCHAVTDKKLTGPGLLGVFDRLPRGEAYFRMYVNNSDSLAKASDPYAQKLQDEYDYDFTHEFKSHRTAKDLSDLIEFLKCANRAIP
jgi:cytochrome c2